MKHNDGSGRAASPRCSRSVWHSVSKLALGALLAILAAACGSTVTSGGRRDVPATVVATTQLSSHDGDTALIVAMTDGARARIAQLVTGASTASDRVLIAVFEGSERTGGYAIRVDRVERDGDTLIVHATFTEPAPGAVVTQVLTSPAQVVSIASSDASGIRTAVLLDAQGNERARVNAG